jgi:chromosomal replication initiation ATPase DnaA
MNQTITVTMDGAPRKVPLTEALAISLFQRALAGNVPAAREAMKIMEKVEAQQNAASEEKPVQYVFRFAEPEMKDCNTALEKLNVIKPVAREYRIATWVVEAALARDNQLLREESNRRLIEVNMLNRDVLETILPKAA